MSSQLDSGCVPGMEGTQPCVDVDSFPVWAPFFPPDRLGALLSLRGIKVLWGLSYMLTLAWGQSWEHHLGWWRCPGELMQGSCVALPPWEQEEGHQGVPPAASQLLNQLDIGLYN